MTQLSKIVMIDCQTAGVAGDMILGALLDLGADKNKVESAIKILGNGEFGYTNLIVEIQQVMRRGFSATKINVTADGKNRKDGNRLIQIVEKACTILQLSPSARQYASKVIHTLVEAEAKLHGNKSRLPDVHLHEVGLVDTAAEIIGCAVALDDLGFFNVKIVSSPVAVGGGLFTFSHGTVSSPSPAALAILESSNFPFKGGPIEAELATPTGLAILVNLASEVSRYYPEMIPLKVGYGAGTKEFKELPNLLRITLGKQIDENLTPESIAVLETNIDDISGEIIGQSIDRLYAEGAKDVSIIPIFTKKNRPGYILKVITDKKDVQHLSRLLIDETGTLGVRIYYCQRHIITRDIHSVELLINGIKEPVKVKVSKNINGEIIRLKPEFEDLKRLSKKTNIPVRVLSELTLSEAHQVFKMDE